ncbi:CMGC family protein kinase [Tritrichomonas foetus]|uniref:CMGC family protein kinase n=1 Tax=Tritrichomonas foetus TaxID=1144522 RepID=A0A1J4JZQ6_9EUKA|nr:CMGC family protein kinase [Tritrichomonas foetus]|eukprot:OHT04170.1 CMGC family protein kinase [Tritrichomonas foetus]
MYKDVNGKSVKLIYPIGTQVTFPSNNKYVIVGFLGCGVFGQVFRVQNENTGDFYALKIGRMKSGYVEQYEKEVEIYEIINKMPKNEKSNFGSMIESFNDSVYSYIVFDLFVTDLYKEIKKRHHNGFPLCLIQSLLRNIVSGLISLHSRKIIHNDLKLENITASSSSIAKIIDFGASVIKNTENIPKYTQSRFYRAPEVILNLEKDEKIDIWSLGCIAVELYIGVPCFAGKDEKHTLYLMEVRLGQLPSSMILSSPRKSELFEPMVSKNNMYNHSYSSFQVKDPGVEYKKLDEHYHFYKIEEAIRTVEFPSDTIDAKDAFIDLVKRLLEFDPMKRISAKEIIDHKFLQMTI